MRVCTVISPSDHLIAAKLVRSLFHSLSHLSINLSLTVGLENEEKLKSVQTTICRHTEHHTCKIALSLL